MHGGVTVVPMEADLVLRVARNMRASDQAEIAALSPSGVLAPDALAAEAMSRSRWGAVVLHEGEPAVAFGMVPAWPGTVNVWLFATDAWGACWRATARFLRHHLGGLMRQERITCAFVFAEAARPDVARMLKWLGFVQRGIVPRFGARDEAFALWSRTEGAR